MATITKALTENVIKGSLCLPKTTFPMRAQAALRERQHVPRLTTELYRRQQQERATAPRFKLHDGPPYANGSLHIGHFLNKVLKDIHNRHQLLQGRRVDFLPGWDCHGLPIELKALQEITAAAAAATPSGGKGGAAAAAKDAAAAAAIASRGMDPVAIRSHARSLAEKAIEHQKADFERWGVMADWAIGERGARRNAYVTMDPQYEAAQLRVFRSMVERGLVYRARKPVYWSPSSSTALAEAELEYNDAHKSTSVFVAFPLQRGDSAAGPAARTALSSLPGVEAVIWTTTPWTLPANVAIAVHPDMVYVVARAADTGKHYLVAEARLAELQRVLTSAAAAAPASAASGGAGAAPSAAPVLDVVASFSGADLAGAVFTHPLAPVLPPLEEGAAAGATTPRGSVVLCGSYVTADSGTGLVHTAPAHGHDDFAAVHAFNAAASTASSGTAQRTLPILCPVDDHGAFTSDAGPSFAGKYALGAGNTAVLAALENTGQLLKRETIVHRYPYDWRTKQPVMIRATPQWFVRVDDLMQPCKEALGGVEMVPAASRNRLQGMLGTRTEWCISRQRSWGVPIPVLYNTETGEALLTPESIEHIASVFEVNGTDAWWKEDVQAFLPPSIAAALPPGAPCPWVKGTDTLDVWFDSGSSWAAAATPEDGVGAVLGGAATARAGATAWSPADLVLEGSDQHRGWFQSSLITGVAVTGTAPYNAVVTHGFVLDEQGRKMSKSLGNVVVPSDVIDGTGAPAAAAPAVQADAKTTSKGGKTPKPAGGAAGGGKFKEGNGADVLRYWVAASDYSRDVSIGANIVTSVAESVRKVRNCARFMLGNLYDFKPLTGASSASDPVLAAWSSPVQAPFASPAALASLPLLDRCLLHRLHAFEQEVQREYDSHAFMRAVSAVNTFLATDLSAQYFDFCKDRLYVNAAAATAGNGSNVASCADGSSSAASLLRSRGLAQATLWEALRVLTKAVAPIVPFTAEDVYQHSAYFAAGSGEATRDVNVSSTVFDVRFPALPACWSDAAAGASWVALLSLRSEVNKLLEQARAAGKIGSALEAEVIVGLPSAARGSLLDTSLAKLAEDRHMADLFVVSRAELAHTAGSGDYPAASAGAAAAFELKAQAEIAAGEGERHPVQVVVRSARGTKCTRCWKFAESVAAHPSHICSRCASVLAAAGHS